MRPKGQFFDLNRFAEDHNLTQRQIAEDVKRPQSFLSTIAHGKRSAPAKLLEDICRLYKVDNLSNYLSEREVTKNPKIRYSNVQNVRNSILDSPGGKVFVTDLKGNLNDKNAEILLHNQNKLTEELSKEDSTSSEKDLNRLDILLKLLQDANQTIQEQKREIEKLNSQVEMLKSQLPKRKKPPTCN